MADEETSIDHMKSHLHHLGDKVDHLGDTVKEHIAMDRQYYKEIDKLTSEEESESMDNSALVAALMSKQGGGADGALGLGGGLLGGVLLGSLLSRNGGLFGG